MAEGLKALRSGSGVHAARGLLGDQTLPAVEPLGEPAGERSYGVGLQ